MSKPYTEEDLSDLFDLDLIWRRKELSDLKFAVKNARVQSRQALLKALVTMTYAHWEGYVRTCAELYFEHMTLRKKPYSDFEQQMYVNKFLIRLDNLYQNRCSIVERCDLINNILEEKNDRFSYINSGLIDTRSNVNFDVIKDICMICGIEWDHFEDNQSFIDRIVVKRRNSIAHGQQQYINESDIDDFLERSLGLMDHFRSLLENKIYTKAHLTV